MAYTPATLSKVAAGLGSGGGNVWIYTTTDALATVSGASYFSDGIARGMKVDDVVLAVISHVLKAGCVASVSSTAATYAVGAIT
ncbi:MAG: hypothetical protein KGP14_03315 [Betaproteobacteria bacterium]|nr:hypothetical protein [Betaproteobacteria bacterium]